MTDTEKEALCARIDELCAENDKLRKENERFVIMLNVEHRVRQNVDCNNVKLRELLAELYEEQCDECDRCKYRDRMHELGVY